MLFVFIVFAIGFLEKNNLLSKFSKYFEVCIFCVLILSLFTYLIFKRYGVGDVPYLLYFGALGDVAYVGREMSCYRRGVATSWTVHHARLNVKELTNHASQIYKMYVEFDKYTDGQFKEICMSREAVYKMQEMVLKEKPRELLTNEYRQLIRYLPITRKVFLVLSLVLPKVLKKVYIRHLEFNNNKWLKNRR